MELDELHVFQREARAIGQGHAVSGVNDGIRAGRKDAAAPAGGKNDGLCTQDLQSSMDQIPGHHSATTAVSTATGGRPSGSTAAR